MLTDAEVEKIRQGVREGLRGSVLVKWLRLLLEPNDDLRVQRQAREVGSEVR